MRKSRTGPAVLLTRLKKVAAVGRPLSVAEVDAAGRLIAELATHDQFASRSQGPWFRELYRALDGSISVTALHRYYSIYKMLDRLGLPPEFSHLGPTHLRNITTLPPSKQLAAIRRADKERASHRSLEEATSYRSGKLVRGRRGSPRFAKLIRELRRFASEPLADLIRLDDIDRLGNDEVDELVKILRAAQKRSNRVLTKLEKAVRAASRRT